MKKALASVAVSFVLAPAASADSLNVKLDQTVEVKLAAAPGSIVVGNPAIVGVRLLGSGVLLITGKSSGETNIAVLDNAGGAIWKNHVAVRRGVKLRAA